jgi:acyl-CoA reductase-like NAD-dependent aldehyde dehydrogenase
MKIPILHFNDVADGAPPSGFPGNEGEIAPLQFDTLRSAQAGWAALSIASRLAVLRRFRGALAGASASLVRALEPRDEVHAAEMISSQIIPLADACQFLEREAKRILRSRQVGRPGRPAWMFGARSEILREPCGVVLVIAPSNYPLLLPGTVVLQALAAGNAVVLKPGQGGTNVAVELLRLLHGSGVDPALTLLLDESVQTVGSALRAGVDKLVFTGSAQTGRRLLSDCAGLLVPAVMELSGSDAMFVRADADVSLAARALAFGLRLNRGATCIAPRRVFIHRSRMVEFETECVRNFAEGAQWRVPGSNEGSGFPFRIYGDRAAMRGHKKTNHGLPPVENSVSELALDAVARGARVVAGEVDQLGDLTLPLLLAGASPSMRLLREDHFSSVAAIVGVRDDAEALAFNEQCPYALGASVFSRNESEARVFASRIHSGSVVINDMIVPTADPRLPFGGRRQSGFGVTRGAEGLLELTVPKVISTRQGRWRPHFEGPKEKDAEFFTHFLESTHAPAWSKRCKAAWALCRSARTRMKHE